MLLPVPSLRLRLPLVLLIVLVALAALVAPGSSLAGPAAAAPLGRADGGVPVGGTRAQERLATTFAPVMALVRQEEPCGPGEPYAPTDVDAVLDDPGVALRGPWAQHDLVEVAPSAEDLSAGLRGYQLDLPGNPLEPGCGYETWARSAVGDTPPTIYAHVATQADVADRLALQFYFYYAFNDFNNKHESDWERIQLEFPAGTAREALQVGPDRAVYSRHYGSTAATWGSDDLEVDDGTHPVVYVSAGSHASQFSAGVFLGTTAEAGFGCDDTTGPHTELRPVVRTIPADPEEAVAALPWIAYQGQWGESGPRRFYEAPTGPNMKSAWRRPFAWSDQAQDAARPVPGAAEGGRATTFFCDAVAQGSDAFRGYVINPGRTLAVLALAAGLVWLLGRRLRWRSAPVPARASRGPTEVVGAAWSLLRRNRRPFALLALPVVLTNLANALVQAVWLGTAVPWWVGAVGAVVTGLVLLVSAGAVAATVQQIDAGAPVALRDAWSRALRTLARAAAPAVLLVAVVLVLTAATLVLLPVTLAALSVAGLLVPAAVVEQRGLGALPRCLRLVRRSWRVVLPVVLLALVVASSVGLVVAALLYVVVPLPFVALNAVPSVVLALLWPFLSLLSAYLFFSATAVVDRDEPAAPPPAAPPATAAAT